MRSIESTQQLFQEVGELIGLPDLTLDEEGYCYLVYQEELVLHFQWDAREQQLVIFSLLDEIIDEQRLSFYEKMLCANLFWQQTGGASLALDKDSGKPVLQLKITDPGISVDELWRVIERFLKSTEELQQTLNDQEPKLALVNSDKPAPISGMTPGAIKV